MIIRCQLCNTPLFELTMRDDEVIIIVRCKHHGEWHKSLIRIEELIVKMREEHQMAQTDDDPIYGLPEGRDIVKTECITDTAPSLVSEEERII